MKDMPMPASVYPTLSNGSLVEPTKEATAFPSIPGVPRNAPSGLINPMFDYDWGSEFNYSDGSGVRSKIPPTVKRVVKMKVPRVDKDGNEVGGVPVVLLGAPLGTYLGWNVVAEGFHEAKLCNYAGGMVPFAKTKADREAAGDPRLSLEERYKNHDGYVAAVRTAAAKAVAAGFLLQSDADRLVAEAAASNVLNALSSSR
jgi:Alpha/beta hydrolase domain